MKSNNHIANIGEIQLIEIIEEIVFIETGESLIKDDTFFFQSHEIQNTLVFNSDMFVSSTDVPPDMNHFQMGRKSVVMNISDLIVKGIKPIGIIISLGLPGDLTISQFKNLIKGIVSYSKNWNIKYLGGDLNKSREIIINPTVFGSKNPDKIIYRKGLKEGDVVTINSKFGLTSVGFDILINKKGNLKDYSKYERSIKSVLEPKILGTEAYFLSEEKLANTSIDSSDGLVKSLRDLMLTNKGFGFEIEINEDLVDLETFEYSREFDIPLETLILNGGEEFIHLFTISPKNYKRAVKLAQINNGYLIKIGKVISEEKVYFLRDNERREIDSHGYEHFK
ncbi:MAG: AIR synthase related protein [Candidatus Lokiarchaeota archaeon]|jgi:thiamine-monophosphate kinase